MLHPYLSRMETNTARSWAGKVLIIYFSAVRRIVSTESHSVIVDKHRPATIQK